MLFACIFNVLHPQAQIAVEAPGSPVKDEEYSPLPSVRTGLDAEAGDALAAERLEVHLVGSIASEVSGGRASGIDTVLEVGAFFCDCADLFLEH